MSQEREERTGADGTRTARGWRDFASSALLVGAVGAILLAGMILKGDRRAEAPGSADVVAAPAPILLGRAITPESAPAAPLVPVSTPEPPAKTPEPVADPVLEKLATRAGADAKRLHAAKGSWTAQLLVACRADTVERVVAASGGTTKLYVLPADIHGDACFRICWGVYQNAKDAAAAADLPKSLRGKDKLSAVEISKVLR